MSQPLHQSTKPSAWEQYRQRMEWRLNVLLVLCSVFVMLTVPFVVREMRFLVDGVQTRGSVTELDREGTYGFTVSYLYDVDGDGLAGSGPISPYEFSVLHRNSPIQIEYLSSDPLSSRPAHGVDKSSWLGFAVSLIASIGIATYKLRNRRFTQGISGER